MARVLYSTTVSCEHTSMHVFEELCDAYLVRAGLTGAENALAIRLSVTEGCTNALKQGMDRGEEAEATLTFLWEDSGLHGGLAVEISDPGPGLPLDNALPPYPKSHIGRKFPLGRVIDQQVIAIVESPWSVCVQATEHNPKHADRGMERFATLAALGRGGYGMLMMALCWDRVTFTTNPEGGTVLRMSGLRGGLPG